MVRARRLRQYAAPVLLIFALGESSPSQQSAEPLPEFGVISIKPIAPNTPHSVGIQVYPGGRIEISGFALRNLIAAAFDLAYWQVSGGEPWMENDIFEIAAKPSDDSRPGVRSLRHTLFRIADPQLRKMLQALLIDRFQLKFHRDTRTGDVYTLKQSGKPLRLEASESDAAASSFGSIGYAGARWVISKTTMAQLAQFAGDHILRAPVSDQTGLSGEFEYKQTVLDAQPNYASNTDSFLDMISRIGLKLERGKGPVDVLVIDGASHPPAN